MRNSPFQQQMVKLKAPEGYAGTVGFRGFELELDDEDCIEVPSDGVPELEAHGFTRLQDAAPEKKRTGKDARARVGRNKDQAQA